MKELEYAGQGVPKGKRFCTVCGEIKRLNHFEGDSAHCRECCEKMMHTRLHWYAFPVLLALFCCAAFSVYLLTYTAPVLQTIRSANAMASENRLYESRDQYESAIAKTEKANASFFHVQATGDNSRTVFAWGPRLWKDYLRVCADADSEYEAARIASEKLNKRRMKKDPELASLLEAEQAYDTVFDQVSVISEEYPCDSPETMQYDKVIQALDSFAAENDSARIKGYVEYFKASAAQFHDPDDSKAFVGFMDKMLEYLPDEYAVAYAAKAQDALNGGRYDEVVRSADAILEKNKNHTEAYAWKAEAMYKSGDEKAALAVLDEMNRYAPDDPLYYKLQIKYALLRGDTDAAYTYSNACDTANSEAADAVFNALLAQNTDSISRRAQQTYLHYIDYSLYEAALMLVMDDADSAFNIAYNYAFNYAYYYGYIFGDGSALTQSVINMTTLCAQMNRNDDSAEALDAVAGVGLCDEVTQQVIDGKYTPRDVFVEGKVEIL